MRAAAALLVLAQGGCVPVISYYDNHIPTRRNVEKATAQSPALGLTREEVLLRLGEPDEASRDGSVSRYRWTRVCGVVVFIPARLTRTHVLTLEFEKDARVERASVESSSGIAWLTIGEILYIILMLIR